MWFQLKVSSLTKVAVLLCWLLYSTWLRIELYKMCPLCNRKKVLHLLSIKGDSTVNFNGVAID